MTRPYAFRPAALPAGLILAAAWFGSVATPGGLPAAGAEDPFAANVRPTEPRSAIAQRETLRAPEGFEVQWVASEPDIHKPMNLAFDALGRLWVTTSLEYPRPAPADRPGRDRLMIFEDFGRDGRARKVTTFADGLNIPIGVYPFRSPPAPGAAPTWKAVVWSIPHLWLMEDTDGDGRADRREVLYGPFDHTRDTHGNQASFRRGFDGWLYATHGFNNDSRVAGRDGHRVHLNSGNTYRVRLDGSRIEQFTWGQVNPFGLAWDPRGNLYSSDCHSEPIYLLLPGGYYPSFGKPHDGLGFAPNMMETPRGSTAIDGISYYADDMWPEEYQDSIFVGDVMTSRVYRDRAVPRGSGRVARAQPDFLVSSDPWFRPVDTTLGPDGALYVADFYNRIIGHYEVPLDHPGRDRERGRIWRVVRRDAPLRPAALAQDLEGLVGELASPSLPRRLLAMHDLADRFGAAAIGRLEDILRSPRTGPQAVHALWLLERLQGSSVDRWRRAMASPDALVRVHASRMIGERLAAVARGERIGPPVEEALALARQGLRDSDPEVQRCSAEALAHLPDEASARALLALRAVVPVGDSHLLHSVRRALRNQANDASVLRRLEESARGSADAMRHLADILPAVNTAAAADLVLRHLTVFEEDPHRLREVLAHAARWADPTRLEALAEAVRRRAGNAEADVQLALFRSVEQGLARRGVPLSATIQEWGRHVAAAVLRPGAGGSAWRWQPVTPGSSGPNPWTFQERDLADGRRARLLSSHPRGEALTGILRSEPFAAPASLAFSLAGHDGVPGRPGQGRNLVRLRDADSGGVLREARPPRQDAALRVEWSLDDLLGRRVVFEAVDGDAGGAFAWLAVGEWSPEGTLSLPELAPADLDAARVDAADLAVRVGVEGLVESLRVLMLDAQADPSVRGAAARALAGDGVRRRVAEVVADPGQPWDWRSRLADAVFSEDPGRRETFVDTVWREAPGRFQVRVAEVAAASSRLTGELVARMEDGRAPVGLLQDRRLRSALETAADAETRTRLAALAGRLPDTDPAEQRLIEERIAAYRDAAGEAQRGREVFRAACAPCHQVRGEGGLVGPQLTGIGTRGIERLCEDILAPNRNVDVAFRSTRIELTDGETVTGLFRRQEGELLVLANAGGTEFTVAQSDVARRQETEISVMPSNFGEALSAEDFRHLLAFLLADDAQR